MDDENKGQRSQTQGKCGQMDLTNVLIDISDYNNNIFAALQVDAQKISGLAESNDKCGGRRESTQYRI